MAVNVDAALVGIVQQLQADNERHRRQITALQSLLNGLTGSPNSTPHAAVKPTRTGRRRKIGAAARRAIGERMKAYWSKRRADKAKTDSAGPKAKSRAKKSR